MKTTLVVSLAAVLCTAPVFAGDHCCKNNGGSSNLGKVACKANPLTYWTGDACKPESGGGGGGSKHCCFKNGGPANQFGNVVACNANPNTFWTHADCGQPPSGYSGYCCMKNGANPIGTFGTKQACLSGAGAFAREWRDKPCPGLPSGGGGVAGGVGTVLNPINAACIAIQNNIEKKADELRELHKAGAHNAEEWKEQRRLCNALKALIISKGVCTLGAHTLSIVELLEGNVAGITGDVILDVKEINDYKKHHGNWPHYPCKGLK